MPYSSVECYLEQLEVLIDDDSMNLDSRRRVDSYIEWLISRKADGFSPSRKRRLLKSYLYHRQGREKYALALVSPSKSLFQRYERVVKNKASSEEWTWAGVIKDIREAIFDDEMMLSIYPEEEQFIEPIIELRRVLMMMVWLYDEAVEASAGLDLDAVIPGIAQVEP